MRKKKEYAKISVSKELHIRLKKDRDNFQETIGGGSWSIDDAIWEIIKIAESVNKK